MVMLAKEDDGGKQHDDKFHVGKAVCLNFVVTLALITALFSNSSDIKIGTVSSFIESDSGKFAFP